MENDHGDMISRSMKTENFTKGSVTAELLGDQYGARPVSNVIHELEYGNGAYRKVEIDEEGGIEVEASGPLVTAITGEKEQRYTAEITDDAIHEGAANRSLVWYKDSGNASNLDQMIHLLDMENLNREYGHVHHEK